MSNNGLIIEYLDLSHIHLAVIVMQSLAIIIIQKASSKIQKSLQGQLLLKYGPIISTRYYYCNKKKTLLNHEILCLH